MRRVPRFFACLSALLVGCSHVSQNAERVAGAAPLAPDVFSSVEVGQFKPGKFAAADGLTLPYRVLPPSHLKKGAAYPLIVQFHGSGGVGTDNASQLERLAKSWAMPDVRERYQAYVLAPQFPIRSANYGPAAPDQKALPSAALNAAIELVKDFSSRHQVDASRVYAVGFSMGGSAAWLSPTLDPSLFAAIVTIAGIAPDNAHAAVFRDLPALVLHGNSDDENPITADRRFLSAIKDVGGQRVRFREYDGLAHQLPDDIYPGFWWRDWLLRQQRR